MRWVTIASVAAAGCAAQPASLALQPTTLPLNARLVRSPSSTAASDAAPPSRGDIPLAESARYVYVEQLLMARAPGLEVQSLGQGQFTMLVRGRPAFADRRQPLVVIDGMQYAENGAEVLAAMTPRDVKRVEVLREAASTAVYGSRGANGVVVVTTRRGDY